MTVPPDAANGPELAEDQPVVLRTTSEAGVHALRTAVERADRASGRLRVGWPTEQLRLFPFHGGQSVVVEVSRAGDAVYLLETLVESASMEEPPHLVLRPLAAWQRLQRRAATRQAMRVQPTASRRLASTAVDSAARLPLTVADLSSGGLRVATDRELQMGEHLELTFATSRDGAELRLRVTVVRVAPPSADQGEWAAGCQFVEPNHAVREQMVQFILAQQGAGDGAL